MSEEFFKTFPFARQKRKEEQQPSPLWTFSQHVGTGSISKTQTSPVLPLFISGIIIIKKKKAVDHAFKYFTAHKNLLFLVVH